MIVMSEQRLITQLQCSNSTTKRSYRLGSDAKASPRRSTFTGPRRARALQPPRCSPARSTQLLVGEPSHITLARERLRTNSSMCWLRLSSRCEVGVLVIAVDEPERAGAIPSGCTSSSTFVLVASRAVTLAASPLLDVLDDRLEAVERGYNDWGST
jgi:hypothetical protein